MLTLKIKSSLITLAREARGLTQSELAAMIGTSQANLNRWESGGITINSDAYEAVVKALGFPDSFYAMEAEILPPAFYRKRDKVDKRTIDKIEANINIFRVHLNQLLKGGIKSDIPIFSIKTEPTPQDIAKLLRKRWKIAKGPLENMAELIEAKGIPVFSFDFETDRVDGRMALTQDKHPVIFINSKLLGDRQRFTLAHELGQMLLYMYCTPSFGIDELSHNANLFAAEFLMPEKEIREDFAGDITLQLLYDLKRKWKVSLQSLLYRADDLGFLSYNQKRYLLTQFNALQIRRREPPELDVSKEHPRLVRELLTKFKTKQKMSIKQLAAHLHLTEAEFTLQYLD